MSFTLCQFDLDVIDGSLGIEPTIGDPDVDDIYALKHKIQRRIVDGNEDMIAETYGQWMVDLFKPFEEQ